MAESPDAGRGRRTPPEPVALLLAGLLDAPVPVPAPRGPSHLDELDAAIEALLVVADRPLDLLTVSAAVDRPVAVVRQAVERIREDYDGAFVSAEEFCEREGDDYDDLRPTISISFLDGVLFADLPGFHSHFELREVATGWRLYARPVHDDAVRALLDVETAGRLSQAALETLAVVAYRQPVTRGQIAAVRAVSVDSVLKTLVARGLVAEVGRSEETGAVLYGTTDDLLVALGIRSIGELPPLAPLLEGAEAATAVEA